MMTATLQDGNRVTPVPGDIAEENRARAGLYGVLAHLFLSAPQRELLSTIADASDMLSDDDASPLALTWRGLCDAAGQVNIEAVREEFDSVFVSPGRPEISLYASSYMSGARRGHLLAELRNDLARAGFARAVSSTEYEDHFSALCDVMRGMIAEEQLDAAAYEAQRDFFRNYLAPWYGALCDAVDRSDRTVFYRSVARFANAFFTNESEYFELA